MQELNKRYRIKVTKLNELRYLSHLDWQSLIIKTFRRMGLKLAMSQGFNPTPRISLSPALPIFIESDCELVYFETIEAIPDNFKELFEANISNKDFSISLFGATYPTRKLSKSISGKYL